MLILLDQDGVLADFERGFHDAWNARMGSQHPAIPLKQRRIFHVVEEYPPMYRDAVERIYTSQGFFRELPVIPGAQEAVRELLELGHDVRICTSPLPQYRYCVPEKYEWVERHLGHEFVQRMIVTRDKTMVRGEMLVDDKPVITGSHEPHWQRVIFDQPYNRQVEGPRMTWANWKAVLLGDQQPSEIA